MAKLNRERGLLERRAEKQAKKAARKRAAADESVYGPSPEEADVPPPPELPD